jgi:hypothetical protein
LIGESLLDSLVLDRLVVLDSPVVADALVVADTLVVLYSLVVDGALVVGEPLVVLDTPCPLSLEVIFSYYRALDISFTTLLSLISSRTHT